MTEITIRDRADHVCARLRGCSAPRLSVISPVRDSGLQLAVLRGDMTIKLGIGGREPVRKHRNEDINGHRK
jgi:hypothetical protein